MSKTYSFRTKLWFYLAAFTAVIFFILWTLQTVFLQGFYDRMLERRTGEAVEEIAAASGTPEFHDVIDKLSREDSLLVFVTDPDGRILYSSDSYKSYYHSEHGGSNDSSGENPYKKGQVLSWQSANYRNLPDGYGDFLEALAGSPEGRTSYTTDSACIYGMNISLEDSSPAVLYASASLGPVGAAASIIRVQLLWVSILSLASSIITAPSFFSLNLFTRAAPPERASFPPIPAIFDKVDSSLFCKSLSSTTMYLWLRYSSARWVLHHLVA